MKLSLHVITINKKHFFILNAYKDKVCKQTYRNKSCVIDYKESVNIWTFCYLIKHNCNKIDCYKHFFYNLYNFFISTNKKILHVFNDRYPYPFFKIIYTEQPSEIVNKFLCNFAHYWHSLNHSII